MNDEKYTEHKMEILTGRFYMMYDTKKINGCEFELNALNDTLTMEVPIKIPDAMMRVNVEAYLYFSKVQVKELMDYLKEIYEDMK